MTASTASPHLADERLDDLVDGLLDEPASDAARAHLAECASCAARLEELRALLALSAAARRPVEPPAELWPLVVASTAAQHRTRQLVLRSLRRPLVTFAVVLVALSCVTTAWVVTRVAHVMARGAEAPPVVPFLDEDATLDRALAAYDHDGGPIPRPRVATLRARLAATDAALRHASTDEAFYQSLAERERVLREIRAVLGRGPRPPRPPVPP
ncbi:hypothetical protein J421_5871 (plasmid) [Gemmatirosa kalamazoonensis]|uniref:Zinc-finger domain-containing protein n=1 Tax=Gemmatirosa kalamazoonensis TaxID=861299 RepID=W0RRT0_9BACT|nr:zf-HC2 domain-containing protein [Gemmatirosa kalamazoonensis]AHG93406.1 hypothetical protein J421_5871 [Gemmatirosa kalamazoonensis]